jgi:thioredoxin reductase (NADPH)
LSDELYDAIIVGAGPAGVTCALELHDSRKNYLLLERSSTVAANLYWSNSIKNYPPLFLENGPAFREHLVNLMSSLGCKSLTNQVVTNVDCTEKTVTANGVTHRAKTIVLASGFSRRELNVSGVDIFAEDIAYDYVPRREHFLGRTVAVVGGGDSASLDALELAESCPAVYLIHRSAELKTRPDIFADVMKNPRIIKFPRSQVKALVGRDRLEALQVSSLSGTGTQVIAAERLVVQIGYTPNTKFVAQQVDMDHNGFIRIDEFCETSAKGVFAVGDITTPGYPRIATAVGHGMLAAGTIRRRVEE